MIAVIASGYSQTIARPASSPATARRPSRGGPSRSFQTSANAAKESSALSTCEKYSVENGRISVATPSVSAVAVPVPGATRSVSLATITSSATAGSSTPNSPSTQLSGAVSAIAARAATARSRL